MRKKGFTLIELLVVIAIIAMLLAILMPALGQVKKMAQSLICRTNLKGCGTALHTFALDNEESYAVQGFGDPDFSWGTGTFYWRTAAGFVEGVKDDGEITVGASLYLLVREVDVETQTFVCPSADQKAYDGDLGDNPPEPLLDLLEVWDFGNLKHTPTKGPQNCNSYAYHLPYKNGNLPAYAANSSIPGNFVMMADKNPFFDASMTAHFSTGIPEAEKQIWKTSAGQLFADWDGVTALPWQQDAANSGNHARDGQNVLFGDGHCTFEKRPDVGYKNDNIYTIFQGAPPSWNETQKRQGSVKIGAPNGWVKSKYDSFLVNDDIVNP